MIESGTIESNRRAEPRRRALLFGTMQFSNGTTSMTCQIRNLSPRGARLETSYAAWIDRRFDLVLGARDERRQAEIIWRLGEEVGVRFADRESSALSLEEEVAFLRAERERLKARIRELTDEN
jgi:hypothetical protein